MIRVVSTADECACSPDGSTSDVSVNQALPFQARNYYKSVSENKEIVKLVSVLSTSINSTKKVHARTEGGRENGGSVERDEGKRENGGSVEKDEGGRENGGSVERDEGGREGGVGRERDTCRREGGGGF